MSGQQPAPQLNLKSRLNPFALPAETEQRFNLLIVAAVMMAISLGHTITIWLSDALRANPDLDPWGYTLGLANYSMASTIGLFLNGLWLSLPWMVLPLALFLIVILIAFAIYRQHPSRIRRRKQLRPVTPHDDARLLEDVTWLAETAGIDLPHIESGIGSRALDGQAFGFPGRYVIRLGGRLRLLLRKRPALFRAIVLHEMGHISNRDVPRTYLAQSLWIAVLVLSVLAVGTLTVVLTSGLIAGIINDGLFGYSWGRFFTVRLPTYLLVLLQTLATLWLLAAMRGGVLRTREFYADWRAALWGAGAALTQILKGNVTPKKTGWWKRITRLHPDPTDRMAVLEDPARLFRMGPEVPFVAGLLMPYTLEGTLALLLDWGMPTWRILELAQYIVLTPLVEANQTGTIWLAWVGIAVFLPLLVMLSLAVFLVPSYFVAQAIGVQMQREAAINLLDERHGCATYFCLLIPALLLAAGLQLGLIITPLGLLAPLWNDRGWLILALIPVWIPAMTVLMWLWLIYAHYFAMRIVGWQVSDNPPQRQSRIYTLGLTVLLWVLLTPMIIGQTILSTLTQGAGPPVIPYESIPISVGISVGLFVLISAVTWLLVNVGRGLRTTRCPTCQTDAPKGLIAGQTCQNCGQPLAKWLYTDYAERELALLIRQVNQRL